MDTELLRQIIALQEPRNSRVQNYPVFAPAFVAPDALSLVQALPQKLNRSFFFTYSFNPVICIFEQGPINIINFDSNAFNTYVSRAVLLSELFSDPGSGTSATYPMREMQCPPTNALTLLMSIGTGQNTVFIEGT